MSQKQERERFYAITTIIFSPRRDPQPPGGRPGHLRGVFPSHGLRSV